jgi:hypothetical protein
MKKNKSQLIATFGVVVLLGLALTSNAASVSSENVALRLSDSHQFLILGKQKISTPEIDATRSVVVEPYAVHEFRVLSNPEVIVRSTNGSVKVVKGASNKVRIEIHITRRGLSLLASDRIGDDFRLVVRQRNNQIYAEVINLKGAAWTSNMPVFDFIVEVPERTSASLHTNFGDISVSGVSGMVDAMTSKGVIHTTDTQGMFKLSTTSGEVVVDSHKGEVFTNLINGDVTYSKIQGESRIKVVSGNIVLNEMRGSILVSNANGSVDLNALMVNQLIDIQTVVGNINVRLPKRGAFDVVSEGQIVQINNDAEVRRTPGGESLNTKVNQGGVPVHLRTRVGQVDIKLE